ncbi:MAG TPA: 50S ribosomal protein L9 [Kiloniellales bacterium]
MQVILLERIEKLGQMGDIVKVKPGYARNYLLPRRKALRATEENLKVFESQRARLEADNLERRGEAESVAGKLEGLSIVLIRQAGEGGQLYGSVSARDMAQALDQAGVKVERSQVHLDKVIKVLGLHPVRIRLHPEVAVTITANVARSEEEARAQATEGHVVSAEEQRAAEEAAIQEVITEVEAEEAARAEREAKEEAEEPAAAESAESDDSGRADTSA